MACTGSGESVSPPAPAPSPAITTTQAEAGPDTGDLATSDVREVTVGGRSLTVAWADDNEERRRGLMEVTDLGDLDGMIFEFGQERSVSFTMRNTLIPLDLYFFDSDGEGVGMVEMVPCEEVPCPSYPSEAPVRYALEVPAGHLEMAEPSLEVP